MHIDWASLAAVAAVAAAAAVTVVLLMSFAVVGLSAGSRLRTGGVDGDAPATHPRAGTAIAVLCVLAAGIIVCYGLYLIVA